MSKGKKPIILNQATINRMKWEATQDATNVAIAYVASAFIAAMRDEKVKDAVLSKVCERAARYTTYLDKAEVTFEQAQEINARYGYRLEGNKK